MYERILVPTDGSDPATTAAAAAVALARRFGADLHAIHVLELGELPPGIEDEGADTFVHQGERAVRTVGKIAADAGIDATTVVVEGDASVHSTILAYADEHNIDCIVMGTYGRTGLNRFVLGSVAELTLRESTVPVMTVHEETVVDGDFDAVLVPTDGSDPALAAADHAVELAVATGAALHIVNVVDLGAAWGDVDPGMILDALEEAGEQAIEAVIDLAEAAGVSTVEATVLSGTPYRAVVEYAEEHDVDCIVMGTHGRTGLERYLLGSVTDRVVRTSTAPVLAIQSETFA